MIFGHEKTLELLNELHKKTIQEAEYHETIAKEKRNKEISAINDELNLQCDLIQETLERR